MLLLVLLVGSTHAISHWPECATSVGPGNDAEKSTVGTLTWTATVTASVITKVKYDNKVLATLILPYTAR
jgi:hypothetical protein